MRSQSRSPGPARDQPAQGHRAQDHSAQGHSAQGHPAQGLPSRPARRRDRHGRGVRGHLAPVEVPLHRTRGEEFDDYVLDAVEEIEQQWGAELAGVEFAVEDVPAPESGAELEFDNDAVVDRGVPLGRVFRGGLPEIPQPVIVVYRRPIEARATEPEDRSDLVFMVVVDLAAEYLGRDVDELGS